MFIINTKTGHILIISFINIKEMKFRSFIKLALHALWLCCYRADVFSAEWLYHLLRCLTCVFSTEITPTVQECAYSGFQMTNLCDKNVWKLFHLQPKKYTKVYEQYSAKCNSIWQISQQDSKTNLERPQLKEGWKAQCKIIFKKITHFGGQFRNKNS